MRGTEDLGVMFEQPGETLDDIAAIRALHAAPVSVDESLVTLQDAARNDVAIVGRHALAVVRHAGHAARDVRSLQDVDKIRKQLFPDGIEKERRFTIQRAAGNGEQQPQPEAQAHAEEAQIPFGEIGHPEPEEAIEQQDDRLGAPSRRASRLAAALRREPGGTRAPV